MVSSSLYHSMVINYVLWMTAGLQGNKNLDKFISSTFQQEDNIKRYGISVLCILGQGVEYTFITSDLSRQVELKMLKLITSSKKEHLFATRQHCQEPIDKKVMI